MASAFRRALDAVYDLAALLAALCLLAILELVKLAMIDLVQEGPFTELMIDAARPQQALAEPQEQDAVEGPEEA